MANWISIIFINASEPKVHKCCKSEINQASTYQPAKEQCNTVEDINFGALLTTNIQVPE